MDRSIILAEINSTAARLNAALRGITISQLDQVPFEGSWTAGETGEHVLKSCATIADLLRGRTGPAHGDPEEKMAALRSIFLNFSAKYQAPEETVPIQQIHPKEGLIHSLQHAFDSIVAAASSLEPHALCLDAEFPGLGYLTRIEWCGFVLYHSQRHLRQLERIVQSLNDTAPATA